MKKILLGLVIAVMMTGSGYAREFSDDMCKFLEANAVANVYTAHILYNKTIKLGEEGNKKEGAETFLEVQKYIKQAHYPAVTWSAWCDKE